MKCLYFMPLSIVFVAAENKTSPYPAHHINELSILKQHRKLFCHNFTLKLFFQYISLDILLYS